MSTITNEKKHNIDDNSHVKESFCGACAAIPLALAGTLGVGFSAKSHQKNKKVMFIVSLIFALAGLVVGIMYYKNCKNCR